MRVCGWLINSTCSPRNSGLPAIKAGSILAGLRGLESLLGASLKGCPNRSPNHQGTWLTFSSLLDCGLSPPSGNWGTVSLWSTALPPFPSGPQPLPCSLGGVCSAASPAAHGPELTRLPRGGTQVFGTMVAVGIIMMFYINNAAFIRGVLKHPTSFVK